MKFRTLTLRPFRTKDPWGQMALQGLSLITRRLLGKDQCISSLQAEENTGKDAEGKQGFLINGSEGGSTT